jgi:hypothetical protein
LISALFFSHKNLKYIVFITNQETNTALVSGRAQRIHNNDKHCYESSPDKMKFGKGRKIS